ncbi:MAG: gamma-glutamylcyclotransferase, partial [Desulfuromonadales bacterium]|nr:gamma-glutamylcyclotransferase [Desulfuromonadales bacterium]NIS44243.1 gamma-glutamylcyclotransferase [Desulfuromonadales bacterium]
MPSCRLLGPVSLPGYRLVFHKIGMDESGKCDLLETGYPDDVAWGVLFSMDEADKPALDVAEGPSYYTTFLDVVFK